MNHDSTFRSKPAEHTVSIPSNRSPRRSPSPPWWFSYHQQISFLAIVSPPPPILLARFSIHLYIYIYIGYIGAFQDVSSGIGRNFDTSSVYGERASIRGRLNAFHRDPWIRITERCPVERSMWQKRTPAAVCNLSSYKYGVVSRDESPSPLYNRPQTLGELGITIDPMFRFYHVPSFVPLFSSTFEKVGSNGVLLERGEMLRE